jgi:LAO/AO transport system kinase
MSHPLLEPFLQGDRRAIARAITLVENQSSGYELLLGALPVNRSVPVTGITGPPGAGKSTLISALIKELTSRKNAAGNFNQVAVVAVDPTSPFTHGSLLGDRLRMHDHFNNPNVFIRSLATRGALGGLSAKTLEVIDVLRAASFDHILIETVGVGQSEVEIVSMANTTVVVLVPEAGDEIQALKSGIMEIADVFVVNKSDREGADRFVAGIHKTLHERPYNEQWSIPVIKTVASRNEGVQELTDAVIRHYQVNPPQLNVHLMAEHAYRLIQHDKMKGITVDNIAGQLKEKMNAEGFNLYAFVKDFQRK